MLAIEQCASGFATFSLRQERVCNTCGEAKKLSEFVIARTGKRRGGRKGICKPCQRVKSATYRMTNPTKSRVEKDGVQHYGVDEKYGDTWQALDAALSMCRMTIPLAKAA